MRDGLPDGQRGNPALGHVSLRHDSSQRTGMPKLTKSGSHSDAILAYGGRVTVCGGIGATKIRFSIYFYGDCIHWRSTVRARF
jgi:hypothetical protein